MDATAGFLLALFFGFGILIIWIVFSVRKALKKAKKRKAEEQRRKREEQRLRDLKSVGLHIQTTVRYASERSLRTEGRHPDTNQRLFFIGVRKPNQKKYEQGELVFVLVDLEDPSNYMIEWERVR